MKKDNKTAPHKRVFADRMWPNAMRLIRLLECRSSSNVCTCMTSRFRQVDSAQIDQIGSMFWPLYRIMYDAMGAYILM